MEIAGQFVDSVTGQGLSEVNVWVMDAQNVPTGTYWMCNVDGSFDTFDSADNLDVFNTYGLSLYVVKVGYDPVTIDPNVFQNADRYALSKTVVTPGTGIVVPPPAAGGAGSSAPPAAGGAGSSAPPAAGGAKKGIPVIGWIGLGLAAYLLFGDNRK